MATNPPNPASSAAPSLTSTIQEPQSPLASSSTASATLAETLDTIFDNFDGTWIREPQSHSYPHQPRTQARTQQSAKQMYKGYHSVEHIGERGQRTGFGLGNLMDGDEDERKSLADSEEDHFQGFERDGRRGEVLAWEGGEWMEGLCGGVFIVAGFFILVCLVVLLGIALGLGFAWLYGGW